MRLYAVALVTWAATITAFSEPNVANLSDEKAVDYTELRDLPERRTARLHVTGLRVEATSSGDRHPDVGSGGSADERGSNVVSSTPGAIYATPLAETIDEYPFQERSRESGYTVPEEEILLVENAGTFGQRVRQDHPSGRIVGDGRKNDGYASFRKSFRSTASPLQNEGGRSYVTVTSEPYVFALKAGSDTADAIPPSSNDSEVLESKASEGKKSEEIFNSVESATEESSAPTETDVASSLLGENDVIPEDPHQIPRARSSRAYNNGTADGVTEGPVEKRVVRVSSSTSVEISPSLQPVKFSGPIVVADLAGRETPETMVDYPDDGDAASSGASSFRSVENGEITPGSYAEDSGSSILSKDSGIATSSIMLNPLQVGIALVNADEIASTDDSEQSAATDTKDYVQEYLQDDLQRLSTVDKKFVESDVENRSRVDYKDEGLQEREGEKSSVEAVAQKVPDNSVEIQKSVEIYHTAPVHEIHYPPVYIQQTSNLGVIETNNIGRSNQLYGQDEQSESRSNYDVYRGNEQSVVKAHAPEQKPTRYNALEDDALGKPMTSALIAEYASSSDADVREQAPVESQPYKYNDARPVLLVPNQFDDTLYDQSDVRHSFKDNPPAHAAKVLTYGGIARQESGSETYRSSEQQRQPINDHQFRAPEMRRPEATQLLLKIIPEGSSANDGFVVPIPRPYPTIEKIVEKTVHVPHPIEIEKVIERRVPFPVERVVEKRVQVPVAVPQLYPVHVQAPMVEKQVIRVPNVYPIHVIERRVPYAVQRLLVQPAPYPSQLQLRLPPAAPSADKPVAAGLTAGLTAARLAAGVSFRPYRADAERPAADSGGSIDSSSKLNDIPSKYRHKTRGREPIPDKPANLRDSAAFEPHNEANASRFYGSIPPYGRPFMYDYNIDVGKGYVPFTDVKLMILPRKYSSHVVLRPQQAAPVRQQIVYNLVERDKDDAYLGPAPPRKISQSKSPPSVTTATLRRSRHPETQYPGSFRQSKMEYGFKPPMVPSVQYDELTATQVEN